MQSKHTVAIAFALSLIVAPDRIANSQVATGMAIAGSAAMDDVISKLNIAITDIIQKLDNSIGSATFLARSNMQILAGDLAYHSKDVSGKIFENINDSQKLFFNNMQTTLNDLNGSADEIASKTDKIIQRTEFLFGMVPFANREPRLRSHTPTVVIYDKGKLSSGIKLKFDGSWLAHGAPSLKMGDSSCNIEDQKEVSITFNCKIQPNADQNYNETVIGSLTVPAEKTFLQKAAGIFGYRGPEKIYPTSLEIMPVKFADMKIVANQENYTSNENFRSANFDTGARHCVGESSTALNVSRAGPEWMIDTSSIAVTVGSSSGGRHMLNNVTNASFQLVASAPNRGKCGPFWKDARGWHSGVVRWRETKKEPTIAPVTVDAPPLAWGEKKIIALPERTKSYVVTMRRFDGIIRQYDSKYADNFVKIESDPSRKSVGVEAIDVSRAFR